MGGTVFLSGKTDDYDATIFLLRRWLSDLSSIEHTQSRSGLSPAMLLQIRLDTAGS